MAKLDDYTVIQLIERYKKIIGTDINTIILNSFPKEFREEINRVVEEQLQKRGIGRFSKEYARTKDELLYKVLKEQIKDTPNLDEDNAYKRLILSLIYVNNARGMKDKDVRELKHLILNKSPYAALKINRDEDIFTYEIITAEEQKTLTSIGNERTRAVIKKSLEEILSINDMSAVISEKYPEEIIEFILSKTLVSFLLDDNKISKEEYKEILNKKGIESMVPKYEEEYRRAVMKYLEENLHLLDIPMLLLNSAARTMLGIKLAKGETIEGMKLAKQTDEIKNKSMQVSIMLLREIDKELEKVDRKIFGYRIENERQEEVIYVDKTVIKEFLERCTKDDYITDNDIENIHNQILEGVLPEDLDARRIANIDIQDLINLNKTYEEKEEAEEKTKLLYCAVELTEYLKSEGLSTNKKLLNLYFNGEINLDFIKNIDMQEITPEEYNQKFKMIYDRILYAFSEEEKEKEQQKLSRLAELYKYLETEGKTDVDDLAASLIAAYGEEYGPDVMADLYELGISTFETCIDWVGIPVLKELCKRGKLPPAKVSEFFEEKKDEDLDTILDTIAEIINVSPNAMQRIMLIGSIFPEDKLNRDELLKRCLRFEGIAREKSEDSVEKKKKGETTEYTKNVIDSFDRMTLMKLIDSEYYFEEPTLDGHVIIHLPSFGEVIVEKMFNRKKESEYGAATYILSEEYFKKNRSRIIQEGKVHRREFIRDINNKEVEKINHFIETWGRKIKEHFGIREGSRWTEEELQKIDEIIQKTRMKELGENK